MATVISKSEDENIECYYDDENYKDYFNLTLPTLDGCLVSNFINKYQLDNLIQALQDFEKKMRFAGAIR